ncbi:MAG: ATP-binding protein [Limisphaerales bacterium]
MASDSSLPFLHGSQNGDWYGGVVFEDLPDFLLDHTLLGANDTERLQEVLHRWTQSVAALWQPTLQVTHGLRFDRDPSACSLRLTWLTRFHDPTGPETGAGSPKARRWLPTWSSPRTGSPVGVIGGSPPPLGALEVLSAMMGMNGLRPRLLTSAEVRAALAPAPIHAGNVHIWEIGNDEKSLPVTLPSRASSMEIPRELQVHSGPQAAAVYGFVQPGAPTGAWNLPFALMTSVRSPISLHILLEPTRLEAPEHDLLAGMARVMDSLARQNVEAAQVAGIALRPTEQLSDPQAQRLAELYADHVERLNQPFLCRAFCISPDADCARQVAQAVAGELDGGESRGMPRSSQFAGGRARPSSQTALTRQAMDTLDLSALIRGSDGAPGSDSGPVRRPGGAATQRLPFLMDARAASALFRFPINLRAGIVGIPIRQRPPDFHPGTIAPDTGGPATGQHVVLGQFSRGGECRVPTKDFCKHTLVVGFTGSGKTNTVFCLLHQLFTRNGVPFLVLESAKREYRGLRFMRGFDGRDGSGKPALWIFTPGNESVAPLRLNPFELLPGVSVESHISHLQTCFEAALPPVGPLSSIIAEALVGAYLRCRWSLSECGPSDPASDPRPFPTMRGFRNEVETVLKRRRYKGDVESNVRAAILGRLEPLLIGSKGLLFSEERCQPPVGELLAHPTILELNDLNEQDKSLVTLFVVTLLREYREKHPSVGSLGHVTVIEEAHNILPDVKPSAVSEGGGADTQARAVQNLCNMLAEIRAYGEAMIIADQSPLRLARDAMRNTNIQIAHQLRDAGDREAVANAMIMDERQRNHLGLLEPGAAAVFYTGLQKATVLAIPNIKEPPRIPATASSPSNLWCGYREEPIPADSDLEVARHMVGVAAQRRTKRFDCASCASSQSCRAHATVIRASLDPVLLGRFSAARASLVSAPPPAPGEDVAARYLALAEVAADAVGATSASHWEVAWCYALTTLEALVGQELKSANAEQRAFRSAFERLPRFVSGNRGA